MSIGGGAPRRPRDVGTEEHVPPPTTEELTVSHAALDGASPKKLIHFVHQTQEARISLTENFDSRFSDLVTAGKGEEYPQLVEQFKALYAACDVSLETIATRLASIPAGQAASKVVTSIVLEERSRADAHLQVQVMRQHKSVAGAAGEEGVADTAEALAMVEANEKSHISKIAELEEELRAEAADMDD
mmetsp:Transcript_11779/g.16865  ORF Transcript_11779/g.16865 Transcript_11779/m.16865 type:complete len:188 (+) Transcript_11779:13-576(+)